MLPGDNMMYNDSSGREYPVTITHCNLIHVEDERAMPAYASKAVDVVMDIHLNEEEGVGNRAMMMQ